MGERREAFAGAGLGLATGLLVGLSAAPVVAGVVAAVAAGLGAFFGLAKQEGPDRALRVGAFGLAASLGLLIGVMVRAGDLAAPGLDEEYRAWTGIGVPAEEARDLVAYARLGVLPRNRETGTSPRPASRTSALFDDQAGLCARLESAGAAGRAAILSEAARAPGAPGGLRALAAAAEGAEAARLDRVTAALCR